VYRRTAEIIDKVLKGANPTDVPIARPTKFELFITLTTAKALGPTSHNHSCCAPKKCRVGPLCGMFVQYRTNFASRLLTGYDKHTRQLAREHPKQPAPDDREVSCSGVEP